MLRAAGAPFLVLTHGNAARAEAQARLLGPSDIVPALSVLERLMNRIDRLRDVGGSAVAARMAEEARRFFEQAFFSGRTVTPELASTGTGLIARAVRHCGIRDWISTVRISTRPRTGTACWSPAWRPRSRPGSALPTSTATA